MPELGECMCDVVADCAAQTRESPAEHPDGSMRDSSDTARAPTEGDVAALADGDELLGRNDLPAAGVQFVEVVNLQPEAGRAAALAAPSRSIEDSGAKPLPRPPLSTSMLVAVRAAGQRRVRAAARSADAQSASHACSVAGGIGPPRRSKAERLPGRREENSTGAFPDAGVRFGAMPRKARPHRVTVKLDADEYAALGARAATLGKTKSQVVRDALRSTPDGEVTPATSLTRAEALGLLAEQARAGSAVAAAAFARELRLEPVEADQPPATTGFVRLRDLPPGALRVVE